MNKFIIGMFSVIMIALMGCTKPPLNDIADAKAALGPDLLTWKPVSPMD